MWYNINNFNICIFQKHSKKVQTSFYWANTLIVKALFLLFSVAVLVAVLVIISDLKNAYMRLNFNNLAVMNMAEDMGLEPTGLLHLTPFPGELLSHSVNPPQN